MKMIMKPSRSTGRGERPLVPLFYDTVACAVCGLDGHSSLTCLWVLKLEKRIRRAGCKPRPLDALALAA